MRKKSEGGMSEHTRLEKMATAYAVLQRVASELDIDVDMQRLMEYSAYMHGVRAAVLRMVEVFPQIERGKDGVRNRALVRLFASSLRNSDIFVNGLCNDLIYDNCKYDRKGRCIECEAHFARVRTVREIM